MSENEANSIFPFVFSYLIAILGLFSRKERASVESSRIVTNDVIFIILDLEKPLLMRSRAIPAQHPLRISAPLLAQELDYDDSYRSLAMKRGCLSGSKHAIAPMSPSEQLVRRVHVVRVRHWQSRSVPRERWLVFRVRDSIGIRLVAREPHVRSIGSRVSGPLASIHNSARIGAAERRIVVIYSACPRLNSDTAATCDSVQVTVLFEKAGSSPLALDLRGDVRALGREPGCLVALSHRAGT